MDNSITTYQQIQPNEKGLVDSIQLYEFLQIKSPHAQWFKRVTEDYSFIEGEDFFTKMLRSSGGRRQQAYDLTIGMAKEACMTARGVIGKQVRRFYLDLEKKLKVEPQKLTVGEESAKFYNNLLARIEHLSPTASLTVAAKVSKELYGIEIPYHALPMMTSARKSATEIANDIGGITANMIGRIIKKLNLDKPPYKEDRLSVAKYTNKEISMGYYSIEAQNIIKDYLKNL